MRQLIKSFPWIITFFAALAAIPAYAAPETRPSNYTNLDDYVLLFDAVALWFFYLITIASVIAILWAAFTYLTAGDDEEKIKMAKHIIIYAVIALAVGFVANGVPKLIQTLLGV